MKKQKHQSKSNLILDEEEEYEDQGILDIESSESDNDILGDVEEEEDVNVAIPWKSRKSTFYKNEGEGEESSDYDSDDDELNMKEAELSEAMRMQAKQAASMSMDDFQDEEVVPQRSSRKSKKSSKVSINLESLNKVEEKVKKNIQNLSSSEKRKIVEQESPELIELLNDFQNSLSSLNEISSTLKKMEKSSMNTSHGFSYLSVKYQILLQYCINLSFYLLLKSEGVRIKDHPVIDQLVLLRTYLEKISYLDAKMKPQIEKYLRISAGNEDETINEETDALSFKPNPESLASKTKDSDSEDSQDEDEEDGVYKPPMMSAKMYRSEFDDEEERKQRVNNRKLARSEIMHDLKSKFSDAPETQSITGVEVGRRKGRALDRRDAEINEYEEENFIRLNRSKKDRSRTKGNRQMEKNFDDNFDTGFGDISAGALASENLFPSRSLSQYMDGLNYKADSKKPSVSGDLDIPYKTRKRKQNIPTNNYSEYHNEDFNEFDEYTSAAQNRSSKKSKREDVRGRIPRAEDYVESDEKRPASRDIIKNRGLTPYRKKTQGNSRVHLREKYKKAMVKQRASLGNKKRDDGPSNYAGERGIRKNIARSTKL